MSLLTKMFFRANVYTSDVMSMVSFTFTNHYVVPPYSARLAKFGWVPLVDLRVQRLATKHNAERVKTLVLTPTAHLRTPLEN